MLKDKKAKIIIVVLAIAVVIGVIIWEIYPTGKTVEYDGGKYREKRDITTVLFLGIDTETALNDPAKVPGEYGQADTIIYMVIDSKEKKVSLISVPRDSMTDVEVYDTTGQYFDTMYQQVCAQFAYGDGGEKSCEMMKDRLAGMFPDITVDNVVAVNMDAILHLNDLVGGVTLTTSKDYLIKDFETEEFLLYPAGSTITMDEKMATEFIRSREYDQGANSDRIDRQKEYMKALFAATKEAVMQRPGVAKELYDAMGDDLYTDMGVGKVVGLAADVSAGDYRIDELQVIPGQYDEEGFLMTGHDQYVIDEDGARRLILECCYDKIR